jgi:hypothetical protein
MRLTNKELDTLCIVLGVFLAGDVDDALGSDTPENRATMRHAEAVRHKILDEKRIRAVTEATRLTKKYIAGLPKKD